MELTYGTFFLETLIVAQLARKLPALDETLRIVTVFSRARKRHYPESDLSSPHPRTLPP
jgi:hypothetical protein